MLFRSVLQARTPERTDIRVANPSPKWTGAASGAVAREQARIREEQMQLRASNTRMKQLSNPVQTSYTQAELPCSRCLGKDFGIKS